jgi:chemotaxis protein methyltransferase CheR
MDGRSMKALLFGQAGQLSAINRTLVCNAVSLRYGYALDHYEPQWLDRQLQGMASQLGKTAITDLITPLLDDPQLFCSLLHSLSVGVTAFFRDSDFFSYLSQQILPRLHMFARPVVWCAGCCTGEEVWSLAILLAQHGLLQRSTIYATDFDPLALAIAQRGVYSEIQLQQGSIACFDATGRDDFTHYFDPCDEGYRAGDALRHRIAFFQHDLLHDGMFCEAALVSCRNVLIYLDAEPKRRVQELLVSSLQGAGFLCLGNSEYIGDSHACLLKPWSESNAVYQKYCADLHLVSSMS